MTLLFELTTATISSPAIFGLNTVVSCRADQVEFGLEAPRAS